MAIRITQAGVALTVGIIIVTALIIGGLFYVKNTGEQARREEAIKIAEQNLNEQSNDGVALNDDANKDSNEATSGDDAAKSEDEATKNEGTNESSNSTDSSSNQSSHNSANELPQTGPADQLASAVIVALITFSAASYITSRRDDARV